MATPVTLKDGEQGLAVIYPELGGWLFRYARNLPRKGWVDLLCHDQAVYDRWPNQMWAGNPVLFPHISYNVAQGKEHHYELNGQLYASPQHGFARKSPWTVIASTESSVTLEISDSERTRPSYPFAFRYQLTYRLEGGRLHWEQRVENRDTQPLPFSSGFHPYFSVPLGPGGERNRCFVRVPRATRYNPVGLSESFFTEPFPAQDLSVGVDVSGTILLGDLATPEVTLVDPGAGIEAIMNYAGAPECRFFALWSRNTVDGFYCLEPWSALPNSFSRPDGCVTVLPPGASYVASFWIDAREIA
jgi:galactose mutarotase-like enzyme